MSLTGIYYFSNTFYATSAYNSGGTPDVTYTIYHDATSLSSGPNTQNWNSAVVNASTYGNASYYSFPDVSGNGFGWTIAYSDISGLGLTADGSWILGNSSIGGSGDVTSGAYSAATLLFLCPATAPVGALIPLYIAGTDTGGISAVVPIAIGVLSYNIGKISITDTPDSITVSGLTTGDAASFYKTKYLSSGSWNVNLVLNPGSISGTTPLETIITPAELVDSADVSTTFTTNAVVYAVLQEAPLIVSVLSYYANQTNANAGVANNDDLFGSSGASVNRIAYYLASNSTFAIGNIEVGGDLGGTTSWNLLDTSGNAYSGNPVSNGASLPGSSLAWYLYPYVAPPLEITAYFSYYVNLSDAQSGATNQDATTSTLAGISTLRIAYTGMLSPVIGTLAAGNISSYTSWSVLDISGNSISGNYNNGQTSSSFPSNTSEAYYLYPYTGGSAPCFLEGSKILCYVDDQETYVPIEQMRKGTLVKTINGGFKMVHLIGKKDIPNFNDSTRIKDRLYKLTSAQYPALTSDLYLTGCHSTLVDYLTDRQKDEIKKMLGVVCVTEGKYRLPACIDENAKPWPSAGTYTVWHFALDDENPVINFGVYANGGLLVETGSIRYLQGKANMELL